jgi:hypothetical protein
VGRGGGGTKENKGKISSWHLYWCQPQLLSKPIGKQLFGFFLSSCIGAKARIGARRLFVVLKVNLFHVIFKSTLLDLTEEMNTFGHHN